jgi:outer membrane protein assembly factor BamB
MKKSLYAAALLSTLIGLMGCKASLPVSGAPIALTTSPEFPAEVLLVPMGRYQDYSLSAYALDTGKVRRRIALNDIESLIDAKVTFDDVRVYVASPGYVRAYAQRNGALVWETPFESKVESSCHYCFTTLDGRVVVQSDAGHIYGLDAATGEVLWRLRPGRAGHDALGFYTPQQQGTDNPVLAFISRTENDGQAPGILRLIKAEDGSNLRQIEATCTADAFFGPQTPAPGAFIRFDRQGHVVYLIFSAFPDATCAQAWDVREDNLLWQTHIPEDVIHHTLFWRSDQAPIIIHRNAVYVGKDGSPHGNGLTYIDLNTGEVRAILEECTEYKYVFPVAQHDNVLIVLVQAQGQDQIFEVWGVDVTKGQRLWSHPTEVTSANDLLLPYDTTNAKDIIAKVTEVGIVLLEHRPPATSNAYHHLHIYLLDTATGEPLQETERRFDYLTLHGMPFTIGDNVYFAADMGLYRFDMTSGNLKRVLGQETNRD